MDSPETAEELIGIISQLSRGDEFEIHGVPQFGKGRSLAFLDSGKDPTIFYAIETEETETIDFDESFKICWRFVIHPERGGPNNGVVTGYATPGGEVPADENAETIEYWEYSYNNTCEMYPRAFVF